MSTYKEKTVEVREYIDANFTPWLSWKTFDKGVAYLHSETTELFEAWRDDDKDEAGAELADILIRLLDTGFIIGADFDVLMAELEFDFGEEIAGTWDGLPSDCVYLHYLFSISYSFWAAEVQSAAIKSLVIALKTVEVIAASLGYNLDNEFSEKMAKNWERPRNHGKPNV